MGILGLFGKKRAKAKGFQSQESAQKRRLQTFILEPILTPIGLVDSSDQAFDPLLLDVSLSSPEKVHLLQSDASQLIDTVDIDDTSYPSLQCIITCLPLPSEKLRKTD